MQPKIEKSFLSPSARSGHRRIDVGRAEPTHGFAFGEGRPFAQCHAPTLVETSDARVVLAFFAGSFEGHPDVGIFAAEAPLSRLAESGAAMDEPRCIAKIAPIAHWNPVLYRAAEGIALQFKVGRSVRRWQTRLARSFDEGRTFEAPVPLALADAQAGAGGGGRGAVRAKPIRLASGDWLAGASRETWRRWDAYFDRSPNGIDGWRATANVARPSPRAGGRGFIQPALWESAPGRVHALLRATDGCLHRCDSDDDGRHWSAARPTELPHNNSAIDVARLADGTLVLACNPVAGNRAPRTPLALLFSRDDGESWPWRLDVESGPGEFSYPALVASGTGLLLCYTWNRRRIAWLRIGSVASLIGTD